MRWCVAELRPGCNGLEGRGWFNNQDNTYVYPQFRRRFLSGRQFAVVRIDDQPAGA